MSETTPTAPVVIKLHRALYMQQAIKDAAETFADFASFSIKRDGGHYAVAMTDISTESDGDVVAEFCNFALFNTMQRKRKRL